MATSKTQLANLALSEISETTIVDINDTTNDAARKCKLHLEPSIREAGREAAWNCLMKRVQLAADSPVPDFGWEQSYTLPTQCLRLVKLNGYSIDEAYLQDKFQIEGRAILTDADEAKIEYVEYTDDVTIFDSLFNRAVITLLASYLAPIIAGDAALGVTLREKYEGIIAPKAKKVDGNEKNARRFSNINNSTWLQSRRIQPGEGTVQ